MLTLRDIDNNLPEENSGTISRLEIAGFYGDHAVFQHGKTAVLRGKTLPAVKVELTVGDCRLAIFSNLLGEFTFRIPPMKPAYGLQLTVAAAGEKVENSIAERFKNIVSENLSDPTLHPANIAKMLNIHPTTLTRNIHAATGMNPMEYITAWRMQLVLSMIRTSGGAVTE